MVWAQSCSLGRVMHRPAVLNQSDFVPAGHLAMSRGIIGRHNREGCSGIYSIKGRDAAKTPPCTGQPFPTKGH